MVPQEAKVEQPIDSPPEYGEDPELAALAEESDWALEVEVGTKSDLDEDLGPGKWVESGRAPEELARELDSLPIVERDFDLNPSNSVFSILLGLILAVALVGLTLS